MLQRDSQRREESRKGIRQPELGEHAQNQAQGEDAF